MSRSGYGSVCEDMREGSEGVGGSAEQGLGKVRSQAGPGGQFPGSPGGSWISTPAVMRENLVPPKRLPNPRPEGNCGEGEKAWKCQLWSGILAPQGAPECQGSHLTVDSVTGLNAARAR